MDNERHNQSNGGQHVGTAPQDHATPHTRPNGTHLQGQLHLLRCYNERLVNEKEDWQREKLKYCFRIQELKCDLNKVEGLLQLRERGFTAAQQKNDETISALRSELSLTQRLNFEMEKIIAVHTQKIQEKDKTEASLEADRQEVLDQSVEMLKLKLENRQNVVVQNQLQIEVKQLREQLNQKNKEILVLTQKNVGLSCRLLVTTGNHLTEVMETKEKEEEETKKREKEEKKAMKKKEKEVKVEMKKKEKEVKAEMKKKEKEVKAEMKKKETEEKEMKMKQKEEKKEMKKKEEEEKKEMKKKEKEAKAEMTKKEKEEKKKRKQEKESTFFFSWLCRRKSCNGDSEAEEAAGCSAQVGQQ